MVSVTPEILFDEFFGPQRLRERGTKALLLQRTAHAQASGASNHV